MNAINKIRHYIVNSSSKAVFSAQTFQAFASPENARQILCRLVKSGEIEPISRGVFAKKTTAVASELPSSKEIIQFLTNLTGEVISIHGSEAARKLGLSTQVPMSLIYYTTGNNRKIKFKNRTITLKHISPRKLIGHGIVGEAFIALWYLGKENVNSQTIKKIKAQLKPNDFKALKNEIPHMPAWMAKAFHLYLQQETA